MSQFPVFCSCGASQCAHRRGWFWLNFFIVYLIDEKQLYSFGDFPSFKNLESLNPCFSFTYATLDKGDLFYFYRVLTLHPIGGETYSSNPSPLMRTGK
jgi:hypothetical protein